jgi:3-oxoacyl-[acyl-carrier protein] reductase
MGQIALVTGGNKGIGLETTRLLAAKGYEVVVVARDFAGCGALPEGVRKVPFDLTDVEGIPDLAAKIGDVDALVNNAGVMASLPFDQYPLETARRLMRLNLETPIALITAVAPGMIAKGGGRIVNTSSLAAHTGHPDVWYGASKAALLNVTKSFAKLLGPKGVTVNAVAPGPVETDMLAVIPEPRRQSVKQNTNTGRFAQAREVAATIVWLLSESPVYINGACIDINDGVYLR